MVIDIQKEIRHNHEAVKSQAFCYRSIMKKIDETKRNGNLYKEMETVKISYCTCIQYKRLAFI